MGTVRTMSDAANEFRTEHDSMGEVRVPAQAKWAAQTQRAVENFPISGLTIEARLVRALALVKGAAAGVNADLDEVPKVDRRIGDAIAAAADEVAQGRWDGEFPIDVYQTGSGTSSNMNANEVIATLATERLGGEVVVHPNDHVNASQSSNDVFPTAIHVAATEAVSVDLVPALEHLAGSLRRKSEEFARVVKSGRTHLMDATPVTLGQEFAGYASQVEHGIERVQAVLPRLGEVPLGGTGRGHRHQRPARLRRPGDRGHGRAHRPAAVRGAGPLRGPGRSRRAGGGVGDDAHGRRLPREDRQRPALDGQRPPHRADRDLHPPTCSRARPSCRAR